MEVEPPSTISSSAAALVGSSIPLPNSPSSCDLYNAAQAQSHAASNPPQHPTLENVGVIGIPEGNTRDNGNNNVSTAPNRGKRTILWSFSADDECDDAADLPGSPHPSKTNGLFSSGASDSDKSNRYAHDLPTMESPVSKWTNYLHGWQHRYLVLGNGVISYYRSKEEVNTFCRGTIEISKATFKEHEFDSLRFDVRLENEVYFFRAATPQQRDDWIRNLTKTKKMMSGAESILSVGGLTTQPTQRETSIAKFAMSRRAFQEKMSEIDAFRNSILGQMDTLQNFFTRAERLEGATKSGDVDSPRMHRRTPSQDFRSEVLTFKATTMGLLEALDSSIALMKERESDWVHIYERIRRREERLQKHFIGAAEEEGSPEKPAERERERAAAMNEDIFFDAVESSLDRIEEQDAARKDETPRRNSPNPNPKLEAKFQEDLPRSEEVETKSVESAISSEKVPKPLPGSTCPYMDLIRKRRSIGLKVAMEDVSTSSGWELALEAENGNFKCYSKQFEDPQKPGHWLDKVKSLYKVHGVSAMELTHIFMSTNKETKMSWDKSLADFKLLEKYDPYHYVLQLFYRRVWPTARRVGVLVCSMTKIEDMYVCCNQSVDHPDAPHDPNDGDVRISADCVWVCTETLADPSKPRTRDNVVANLVYQGLVNPGGWVPSSVIKAVATREYPKVLSSLGSEARVAFSNFVPISLLLVEPLSEGQWLLSADL
eukprot:UC4_evm1s436